MKCRLVPEPALQVTGRVRHLCPGTSDVDFLRDLKRVVDLNPCQSVAIGAESRFCITALMERPRDVLGQAVLDKLSGTLESL